MSAPQHPEALALCSCKDARRTHKEQSHAQSKHPCVPRTEWIHLDVPSRPLTLVERGCINAGRSLCVSKPYSLGSADTDIDSWITTPLPESIKSLHGIDWAEGGGREWMWGQGEEVASIRTLKSIDGFLTVSPSLLCAEKREGKKWVDRRWSRRRYLPQTDYCLTSGARASKIKMRRKQLRRLKISLHQT